MKKAIFAFALLMLPGQSLSQESVIGDWEAVFVGPIDTRPKPFSRVRFTVRSTSTGLIVQAQAGDWPGVLEVSDVKLDGNRFTFTGTGKKGWSANLQRRCCPTLTIDGFVKAGQMNIELRTGATDAEFVSDPVPMRATRLSGTANP